MGEVRHVDLDQRPRWYDLERLLDKFQASYGAPLPEPVVVRHLYQIASALAYIHEQPLLHRDLKPSNMILLPSGLVKVIDFSLAKLFRPGRQGTGLGTQGYAAPEQYRGEATPKIDLYALGATAHHLLSGRDPQLETPFDEPSHHLDEKMRYTGTNRNIAGSNGTAADHTIGHDR